MKNKEYLNEKEYKKINKVLIVIGIILIVVGIALIATGIMKDTSLPSMSESLGIDGGEKWFDQSSNSMLTIFLGMCASMIGIVVLIIPFKRKIMAYQAQQVMPVAKEGIEKLGPSIGKVAGDIAKEVNKENK